MAISDSKYTGKNTKVKLKRLMNGYSDSSIRSRVTKEIMLGIHNEVSDMSGKIISTYKYMTSMNVVPNTDLNELVVSSLSVNGYAKHHFENDRIVVVNKTDEGYLLKSTVKVEE